MDIKIDWAAVEEAMGRESWKPGIRPDPDAGPYETRRVQLLPEARTPSTEGELVELVDEAARHGYTTHTPKDDGLWVSETRYPEPSRD